MICMSVGTQFSKLIENGKQRAVKCLNIGTIKTHANGFTSSYEALKSLLSITFAHVAPDRSFDLQGCETRTTAICL